MVCQRVIIWFNENSDEYRLQYEAAERNVILYFLILGNKGLKGTLKKTFKKLLYDYFCACALPLKAVRRHSPPPCSSSQQIKYFKAILYRMKYKMEGGTGGNIMITRPEENSAPFSIN